MWLRTPCAMKGIHSDTVKWSSQPWRRALTVAAVLAWSAVGCGTSGGGGGFSPGVAAGSPCVAEGSALCGTVVAGYAVLRCKAGIWQVDAACGPTEICTYIGSAPVCQSAQAVVDAASGSDLLNADSPGQPVDATLPLADGAAGDAAGDTATVPDAKVEDASGSDALSDATDAAPEVAECTLSAPGDCDDTNPCTVDKCKAGKCVHTPAVVGAACGTAKACTTAGDCACVNPKKTGDNCTECVDPAATGPNCVVTGSCQLPSAWSGAVQAVSSLTIAPATEGCDLDGDGKVNNAMAKGLSGLLKSVNDSLNKGVADGSAAWLLHMPNWTTNGSEFAMSVMTGKLDAACDTQSPTAKCQYLVDKTAYDTSSAAPTCPAAITYPNTAAFGGLIGAPDIGQVVPITMYFQGVALTVIVHQASVAAKYAASGTSVTSTAGINCGVILKSDVLAAISAIPEAQLQQLGMDAATMNAMVTGMLKEDIDADGDGTKDSYSFAYLWQAVPAKIIGVSGP